MVYRFTAYTIDKRIVEGTIEAASESLAEEALYRAGHQRVLSLKEVRSGISREQLLPSFFGVKAQEVIDFSRKLATFIESGITILTALELLKDHTSRRALRKVISGLVDELRAGGSLSKALSKYPQVFPSTYCQVIKASEQAGNLEFGLRQTASYMEQQLKAKKKIKRALAYPTLVLVMAAGVFALLVTVALPPLIGLFTSFGVELPWTTRLLLGTADFLINYKLHLVGGILAFIILLIGFSKLPAGKSVMDRLLLKLPVIGSLIVEKNMAHFSLTTSMLLKAGLLLPQIMNIVISTISNEVIRQALSEVRERLVQGQGLSQPMKNIKLFPRLLVEMVVVGERTGNLESTLATAANYYEERVGQKIDTLISMIEPTLTLVVGSVVAFIALSMITPLYQIIGSIR